MHGVYRIPVNQKELEEIRERVKEFEDIPSVFTFPGVPEEF